MIVAVTNSEDVTADYLCARLASDGVAFVRLDTDTVAQEVRISLLGERLVLAGTTYELLPADVTCVWLRRPKEITVGGAETAERTHTAHEWSEALEGFLELIPAARWINHPAANKAASPKIKQLIDARSCGLIPPPTIVTQNPDDALSFYRLHEGNVIVKPLSGGYLERGSPAEDTQIFTSRVLPWQLDGIDLVRSCPTLFQKEIEKVMDVRLTAVDRRLTAISLTRADETGLQVTDIRRDNMRGVAYRRLEVPSGVSNSVYRLMDRYNLRYAALDFAIDQNGQWIFFEVNPGGQWAWLDLAGISDIAGDMVRAMTMTDR